MSGPPSTYRCVYGPKPITLVADVAQDVDIPIDGARDWTVSLLNTGANPLTALSVTRIPISQPAAASVVADGIPLAAGDALAPIVGENAPLKTLRLRLRSTLGTTVSIEAGGE